MLDHVKKLIFLYFSSKCRGKIHTNKLPPKVAVPVPTCCIVDNSPNLEFDTVMSVTRPALVDVKWDLLLPVNTLRARIALSESVWLVSTHSSMIVLATKSRKLFGFFWPHLTATNKPELGTPLLDQPGTRRTGE